MPCHLSRYLPQGRNVLYQVSKTLVTLVRARLIPALCDRDPQDPAFSPVRDILEKHSATHMWKLTISLAMYLSVLAGPLGCMLLALRWQPVIPQLLPLRWHIG